jgi:hypothetical protein
MLEGADHLECSSCHANARSCAQTSRITDADLSKLMRCSRLHCVKSLNRHPCRNEFSAYLLLEKTNSSGGAAVPSQGPAGGSSGLTFSSVDAPVLAAGVAHRELISGLMHVDTGNGPDKWYR